ncbi:MAG: hypothetical protein OXU64_02310 [Gemmatimonadota bacterium]|nr:hypothetical protein [Gemmatimonadota bacterium]
MRQTIGIGQNVGPPPQPYHGFVLRVNAARQPPGPTRLAVMFGGGSDTGRWGCPASSRARVSPSTSTIAMLTTSGSSARGSGDAM